MSDIDIDDALAGTRHLSSASTQVLIDAIMEFSSACMLADQALSASSVNPLAILSSTAGFNEEMRRRVALYALDDNEKRIIDKILPFAGEALSVENTERALELIGMMARRCYLLNLPADQASPAAVNVAVSSRAVNALLRFYDGTLSADELEEVAGHVDYIDEMSNVSPLQ